MTHYFNKPVDTYPGIVKSLIIHIMSNNLTKPAQVRKFILEIAKANRHHIFTQVRQESLDKVEAAARSAARAIVMSAPSKGKTL